MFHVGPYSSQKNNIDSTGNVPTTRKFLKILQLVTQIQLAMKNFPNFTCNHEKFLR